MLTRSRWNGLACRVLQISVALTVCGVSETLRDFQPPFAKGNQ
jgi:hypothetical protein